MVWNGLEWFGMVWEWLGLLMGRWIALAIRVGGVLVVQTEAFLSVGRLCTSCPPVDAWALDGDLFLVAVKQQ